MANKLIWFTHDHNAHDDPFLQDLMDRFDHFGYAAYFIILELLHKDGVGDALAISPSRLCQKLRSKPARVRQLLDFCRTSGKVESDWKPTEVLIQIKKFRERQSKMKSKIPPTFRQPSVNLPLEEKREEKKRKETDIAPTAHEPKIVKPKTAIQRVVEAYKMAKNIPRDDKAWDKSNFGRYSKSAANLLACFGQDVEKSAAYIFLRAEDLNEKRLDWTLETITRHAFDGIGIPKKEDDREVVDLNRARVGTSSAATLAHESIKSIGSEDARDLESYD